MGLLVLDEVHYLGDPSRGSVWEEVIINCPPHIQMLAMSATIANADDLGDWINKVAPCAPFPCPADVSVHLWRVRYALLLRMCTKHAAGV